MGGHLFIREKDTAFDPLPCPAHNHRMSAVPQIFDRALARARLARAYRIGFADFLVAHAADDLGERLRTIVRKFALALDLCTPSPRGASALGGMTERVVRAAPVAGQAATHVVADAEALPFAGAGFDLIVSLLALQSVNDLPGALLQIRRALKPDGLFLAALFGGDTLIELRQAFAQAETDIEGGVSPRVAPFVDVRDLGSLLQRAGFALPVTDVDRIVVRYRDVFALMHDLRAMGLTNALVARRRTPLRRATLMRMAEVYGSQFSDADGRLRATFDIVWLSGWAPHASQQQPLRPGSAKTRLADALGVKEEKVKR
jgi:SAM-dependent methyltransferase